MSRNKKKGQGLVEYVIIVVIVAIAAIAIVGVFSDTIRDKFGGAVSELGGDDAAKDAALQNDSAQMLKDLQDDGFQ